MRNQIVASVLPGQSTDGSGKVCIHLFVPDESGPFTEPHALHPVYENGVQVKQTVAAKSTRGRLACNPKRNVAPVTRSGVTTVTARTDDPRGVTCPKCLASEDYAAAMAKIDQITGGQVTCQQDS